MTQIEPFDTNTELLSVIQDRGYDYRVIGYSPGGEPLIVVESGGEQEPAIVISAGSHAGEHAGVRAAVELLDRVDTDHRFYVYPTRDPIGLNGYDAALSMALGSPVTVDSFQQSVELIQSHGHVVLDDGEHILALIGDTGFFTQYSPSLPASGHALGERYLEDLGIQDDDVLNSFKGRRVYLPSGLPDVAETGTFDRAHTLIISPQGAVKHLNRFYGKEWAPVESRCLTHLFADVAPGLFIDLHEFTENDDRFHISIRRTGDDQEERFIESIGQAAAKAVDAYGGKLASWEDKFGNRSVENHHYTPVEDGVFWLEHKMKNKQHDSRERPFYETPGHNSSDYVAENYGFGFGLDTGMYAPFTDRVEQATNAVQAAISTYTDRIDTGT